MGLIMAKKEQTIRFTVSLHEPLLDRLDKQVAKKGYASRSECVRDLIRDEMIEDKWRDAHDGVVGEDVVGVLTIGYDHHQRKLTEKLVDIQHNRYVNVLCATHVHLDHDNCLEAIILRGKPAEIEKIQTQIGALRGVKFARLSRASRLDV
jgi:CopG family nickel-responsive transcriptional regulator